jgi:glutamate racemase
MMEKNIDTVVLGCTHYPFVIPLIQRIVGDDVRVVDPAPSVAKQVRRLLEAGGGKNPSSERGNLRFFTSGDTALLGSMLPMLLGEAGAIKRVEWLDDQTIR